ncbi:MAG: DUF72 domain-containing protein [Syntrophorhabdales bacterium]|jgi:uncharacterized protein YecE (DUF72 family)
MIHVGICSWAEKTLVESGEFYPREARTAEARLRYYASRFDTVEVDSTYYAIPEQRTAWLWDARTPGDFTFHIKVYGALTGHAIDPRTLPADLRGLAGGSSVRPPVYLRGHEVLKAVARRFMESLLPLRRAGKLGLMVFQFPPWFDYRGSNMDYILFCKEVMADLPVAVEFRHGSWLSGTRARAVLGFLKRHNLTYVAADEPQYGTLATVPFVPSVTTDTAYFRFHGRNRDNWLKKGVATSLRYAYSYSDSELRAFVPALEEADRQAKKTYAMFNNCHRGNAASNAARLSALLKGGEGPD